MAKPRCTRCRYDRYLQATPPSVSPPLPPNVVTGAPSSAGVSITTGASCSVLRRSTLHSCADDDQRASSDLACDSNRTFVVSHLVTREASSLRLKCTGTSVSVRVAPMTATTASAFRGNARQYPILNGCTRCISCLYVSCASNPLDP